MRMRWFWLAGLACGLVLGSATPLAAEQPVGLSVSAGLFEVLMTERDEDNPEIGGELWFAPRQLRFLPDFVPPVTPVVGGMVTSRGSLYLFGGLGLELPLGHGFAFAPSFGVGAYHRADAGKDLGGVLQFRSSLELVYRTAGHGAVGLGLYHLSNAGIDELNPGSESLLLTYRVDLRRRARRSH